MLTVQTITLSDLEQDTIIRPLSYFGDSLTYYVLETDTNCLISEISDVYFSKNEIIVFDSYLNVVRVFRMDGTYKHDLDDHQTQDLDTSGIHQVYYSERDSSVFLYTLGRRLHQYTINGDLICSTNIKKILPFYVYPNQSDFLLIFPYPRNLQFNNYLFGIVDSSFNVLSQFGYREVTWRPQKSDRVFFPVTYVYQDTICYWDRYADTVYGIVDNELTPRIAFVETNPLSTREKYYEVKNGIETQGFEMYNFVENIENFFIESIYDGRRNFFIYNKVSHKIIQNSKDGVTGSYRIQNDLDCGPPFWPNKIYKNDLLMYLSAEQMMNTSQTDSSLNSTVSIFAQNKKLADIKIQDNPIIISLQCNHE